MTRYATLLTVTAFAFLAAACNTVEGVGKDVEKVGSKLEETAKDKNPD
ncbi:entericidin A/B family lipoprotein [Hirschia litorea]|uniref:Entericidin A/B family lipoprotein n=1 Tax=Hirschia litorea TaxID=1199156 RepID=A0ABW2IP45_9PROT